MNRGRLVFLSERLCQENNLCNSIQNMPGFIKTARKRLQRNSSGIDEGRINYMVREENLRTRSSKGGIVVFILIFRILDFQERSCHNLSLQCLSTGVILLGVIILPLTISSGVRCHSQDQESHGSVSNFWIPLFFCLLFWFLGLSVSFHLVSYVQECCDYPAC